VRAPVGPVFATLLAMPARRLAGLVALTVTTLLAATPSASAAPVPLPRPDHVLVVVMENKDPGEIIGNASAPYLTGLARAGASFTDAHAETHPSQPNYLALFSGSTQGVTDNGCDHRLTAPNLGSALLASGRTFAGYSEGLPQAGSTVPTDTTIILNVVKNQPTPTPTPSSPTPTPTPTATSTATSGG